jgi:hypothetical protein
MAVRWLLWSLPGAYRFPIDAEVLAAESEAMR